MCHFESGFSLNALRTLCTFRVVHVVRIQTPYINNTD